jgi:RNA polymerase sigma-70 factor (ECF subfamily)
MDQKRRFEAQALPHLDAAYNFALWLARSEADAQDIVQDAMLRAFRAFDGFQGTSAKPWLLAIVRNCWRNRFRGGAVRPGADEAEMENIPSEAADPENAAIAASDARRLKVMLALLPDDFREVLVLREMEDMSYREISQALDIPVGTVMSRLARARALLREKWTGGADGLR